MTSPDCPGLIAEDFFILMKQRISRWMHCPQQGSISAPLDMQDAEVHICAIEMRAIIVLQRLLMAECDQVLLVHIAACTNNHRCEDQCCPEFSDCQMSFTDTTAFIPVKQVDLRIPTLKTIAGHQRNQHMQVHHLPRLRRVGSCCLTRSCGVCLCAIDARGSVWQRLIDGQRRRVCHLQVQRTHVGQLPGDVLQGALEGREGRWHQLHPLSTTRWVLMLAMRRVRHGTALT